MDRIAVVKFWESATFTWTAWRHGLCRQAPSQKLVFSQVAIVANYTGWRDPSSYY